jgi:hypothetical protein
VTESSLPSSFDPFEPPLACAVVDITIGVAQITAPAVAPRRSACLLDTPVLVSFDIDGLFRSLFG